MSDDKCPHLPHCEDRRTADKEFRNNVSEALTDLNLSTVTLKVQHAEVKERLDKITDNQEKIFQVLVDVKGLLIDVDNLRKSLDDHKDVSEDKFIDISKRIQRLEERNLENESRKSSWYWQMIMIIFSAMLGGFLGWLFHIKGGSK